MTLQKTFAVVFLPISLVAGFFGDLILSIEIGETCYEKEYSLVVLAPAILAMIWTAILITAVLSIVIGTLALCVTALPLIVLVALYFPIFLTSMFSNCKTYILSE